MLGKEVNETAPIAVACFKNERRVEAESGIVREVGIIDEFKLKDLSTERGSHKEIGLW